MTENKRFYFSSDDNQNIYDALFKCYYSSIHAEKIYKLLNELYEENQELQSRIKYYDNALTRLQDLTERKLKENDELKKELDEFKQPNCKKCIHYRGGKL